MQNVYIELQVPSCPLSFRYWFSITSYLDRRR